MSLRTLNLPLLLNTSDHDLIADFFAPALADSFRYDRGVGYLAAGWPRRAWRFAIAELCYNLSGSRLVRQKMKWREVIQNGSA